MWRVMNHSAAAVFVETTDEGVERVRSSRGKYAFLHHPHRPQFHVTIHITSVEKRYGDGIYP